MRTRPKTWSTGAISGSAAAGLRAWASRYADREVDFADATLVWLAGKQRTNLIATTDFNDFEAYRLPNSRSFRNLLTR